MARCEDYPCCGHGEAGDGGPCPDEHGNFPCLGCGKKPYDASVTGSSYCSECLSDPRTFHDPECPGCPTCDYEDWDEDEDEVEDRRIFEFEHNIERLKEY